MFALIGTPGGISVGEILIIITTTASAIVTVINAVAAGWGRLEMRNRTDALSAKTDKNTAKLDVIHESTNGNLGKLQDQLTSALIELRLLKEARKDA